MQPMPWPCARSLRTWANPRARRASRRGANARRPALLWGSPVASERTTTRVKIHLRAPRNRVFAGARVQHYHRMIEWRFTARGALLRRAMREAG